MFVNGVEQEETDDELVRRVQRQRSRVEGREKDRSVSEKDVNRRSGAVTRSSWVSMAIVSGMAIWLFSGILLLSLPAPQRQSAA